MREMSDVWLAQLILLKAAGAVTATLAEACWLISSLAAAY